MNGTSKALQSKTIFHYKFGVTFCFLHVDGLSRGEASMPGTRPTKRLIADIDFTLRRVFHQNSFRPYQRDIITAALEGNDVFVQAATSFGKSLCYQLPALIDHGITIVISPLLALVNNQVAALTDLDIPAAAINSATHLDDRRDIMKDLCCGHPTTRLLYVTPELVLTESFRRVLGTIFSQGELARIAVDEAHCVSEWGHDFRPAYRHLSHFRANYPSIPIMCLTATATASVRADIIKTVGLNSAKTKTFFVSTARPNLHYNVCFTSDESNQRFPWLLDFIKGIHTRRAQDTDRMSEIMTEENPNRRRADAVSGIIYVSFRAECDTLATRLRTNGIGAAAYHAGLSALEKTECQQKWLTNTPGFDVIVATTAFGMGIDKKDVRFVIHWTLPKSFEGYYQEAGRAGRDGNAAICILFYSREDRDRASYRIAKDLHSSSNNQNQHTTMRQNASEEGNMNAPPRSQANVQARVNSFQELVKYSEQTDTCRHILIGKYFGEEDEKTGSSSSSTSTGKCDKACDVCFVRPGEPSLKKRKEDGLSSEEWVSTQRERDGFYDYD